MAEICDRVPILVLLAFFRLREDDAMHSALQQAVCPVRQQIADVHEDGRSGERSRVDGHRSPGVGGREDLKARLRGQLEEQRHAAVIRVGAGADVGLVGERGDGGVLCSAR